MPTLQELERPIEEKIASALIEATPEWWKSARLEVGVRFDGDLLGMPHSITNPDGMRDIVAPTDNLMALTFDLLGLFRKNGRAWKRLVFLVRERDGQWDYSASFEY